MSVLDYILIALLLLTGLFVIVAVLFQNGSSKGLSNTVAGGADTFYGRDPGRRKDRILNKWTTIATIVFVVLVLLVYFKQPDPPQKPDGGNDSPVGQVEMSDTFTL